MSLNTFKTAFGFVGTLVERNTPLKFSKDTPQSVFNYLELSDELATSGQPTAKQFENIKQAGFETVINLLPHNHENALPDQQTLMGKLGLAYIYIPVDFKSPQEDEFDAFCNAMDAEAGKKVWVHCAANMRVSAFIYRYRTERLGTDKAAARADMDKIWAPYGVWKTFIAPRAPAP
ncbi:MAG: protein tyrosine phosphatase family protein [Pseudomonadota bacterium]